MTTPLQPTSIIQNFIDAVKTSPKAVVCKRGLQIDLKYGIDAFIANDRSDKFEIERIVYIVADDQIYYEVSGEYIPFLAVGDAVMVAKEITQLI